MYLLFVCALQNYVYTHTHTHLCIHMTGGCNLCVRWAERLTRPSGQGSRDHLEYSWSVCTHICMYIPIYVSICTCLYPRPPRPSRVLQSIAGLCTHICMFCWDYILYWARGGSESHHGYVYTHTLSLSHTQIYIYKYILYTYIHTHTYTHASICIHIHIHIHIFTRARGE